MFSSQLLFPSVFLVVSVPNMNWLAYHWRSTPIFLLSSAMFAFVCACCFLGGRTILSGSCVPTSGGRVHATLGGVSVASSELTHATPGTPLEEFQSSTANCMELLRTIPQSPCASKEWNGMEAHWSEPLKQTTWSRIQSTNMEFQDISCFESPLCHVLVNVNSCQLASDHKAYRPVVTFAQRPEPRIRYGYRAAWHATWSMLCRWRCSCRHLAGLPMISNLDSGMSQWVLCPLPAVPRYNVRSPSGCTCNL